VKAFQGGGGGGPWKEERIQKAGLKAHPEAKLTNQGLWKPGGGRNGPKKGTHGHFNPKTKSPGRGHRKPTGWGAREMGNGYLRVRKGGYPRKATTRARDKVKLGEFPMEEGLHLFRRLPWLKDILKGRVVPGVLQGESA